MIQKPSKPEGSPTEVLLAFLRLGCLSFGGPIAHIGYFHTEFVERRRWCTEETFAELVALAQSLPGPASSQVAFALGLLRAKFAGAAAAWAGFTLPSALLMVAFAFGHAALTGPIGTSVLHGLQIVAVAIVAQAIVTMQRTLAPDAPRLAIALAATAIVLFAPTAATLLALLPGALLGTLLPSGGHPVAKKGPAVPVNRRQGLTAAILFLTLLILPSALVGIKASQPLSVFNAFYRTGALVFGGGHVVLPLLEHAIVVRGWVDQQTFLSGYGAVQAMPGPLFTFAAFLGAAIRPSFHPLLLSAIALAAIFLPGLLLMIAVLPLWSRAYRRPRLQAALRGVNAAVVGILLAAFIRPVWPAAVHSIPDALLALAAFIALTRFKLPPWIVVLASTLVAVLSSILVTVAPTLTIHP